jgi:drug/metabolite transporter (DMT)-like permease
MTPPPRNNRRAIWTMLAAVGFFSLMDGGLKLLSTRYPPFEVAALRGAASLPLVLSWACATAGWRSLLRIRWPMHLLRVALGVAMMGSFIYGVKRMPLSSAYTIFFVAPLLITALSVPFLHERVGPRRWAAIAVGFAGVLIALRPNGEGMTGLAGLAILFAALGYAVSAITVRVLARTDSTQAMMSWLLVGLTLGAGALAAPEWVPISASHVWLILGVGIAGALGQYSITEAFIRGEASVLAPLEYTALAWGLVLDFSVWGVLPDTLTWLGAAIIVASGLYLLRREPVHVEAEHP